MLHFAYINFRDPVESLRESQRITTELATKAEALSKSLSSRLQSIANYAMGADSEFFGSWRGNKEEKIGNLSPAIQKSIASWFPGATMDQATYKPHRVSLFLYLTVPTAQGGGTYGIPLQSVLGRADSK